jgi:hypothetical protein
MAPFVHFLYTKLIILPRQARDKPIGNHSKQCAVFLQEPTPDASPEDLKRQLEQVRKYTTIYQSRLS